MLAGDELGWLGKWGMIETIRMVTQSPMGMPFETLHSLHSKHFSTMVPSTLGVKGSLRHGEGVGHKTVVHGIEGIIMAPLTRRPAVHHPGGSKASPNKTTKNGEPGQTMYKASYFHDEKLNYHELSMIAIG